MNPIRSPRRAALALAVTVLATSALAPTLGPSSVSAQLLTSPPPSAAAASPAATPDLVTPAPPTAPPPSASPSATPTRPPRHHGSSGSSSTPSADAPTPTPTPTSPAFSTLDGYWEVVLQTPTTYTYSSFNLHQTGDEITGTWNHDGKKVPLTGNYDGRQFKFVTQDPVHAQTLAGYVEGATDMVGIVDDGTPKNDPPAFTASHRESTPIVVFPKRSKP